MTGFVDNLEEALERAKQRFPLGPDGVHGLSHWQRVRDNGLRVAKHSGADREIVQLFAYLHDCCRENNAGDPEHGPRAADFTLLLRDEGIIRLDVDRMDLLLTALRDHTRVIKHADVTVGTCWDADRLDIGRVGSRPRPHYLNTAAARDEQIIRWAYKRSIA